MKVFITGSTGYIGFAVARALRRAGHEVWGLARSDEKARALAAWEIHPVMGTMQAPESFRAAAERCSVLIHVAADMQAADPRSPQERTVAALIESAARGAAQKALILTSGCWVHGDTACQRVDESTPLKPAALVAWRPALERTVLESSAVRGLVVRPACVYGGTGGLTRPWLLAGDAAPLEIAGSGAQHWSMVHVEDLAEGYLRLAESAFHGEIFEFAEAEYPSVRAMVEAAAQATGHRGETRYLPRAEAMTRLGPLAEGLMLDQHVDAGKATRLLGWHPRHAGFVAEAQLYAHAAAGR